MMKEDAVSEETPRKRRTRAAVAPEGDEATTAAPKKPAARRKKAEAPAEEVAQPTSAAPEAPAPKKTTRRKKSDAAAGDTLPLPGVVAPSVAPPPPAAPPPAVVASPAPPPAAVANAAPAGEPAAQSSAAAPAAPAAPAREGGGRRERNRHRHERRQAAQGEQQGQQQQQQSQPQPPQGQQQAQGEQGQQQGGGRRRRKRRRGGGGGGGAQQINPQLEAQMQPVSGLLEVDDRGNGRLRSETRSFQAQDNDPDVPKQLIERLRLRPGVLLNASALPRNGKLQVQRVELVDGVGLEEAQNRISFMNLTSVDPDRRIKLETTSGELLTRAIDIIAPIGFGQRGLIVAPPKTGKTIILQKIAKAVLTNHPKARLMVVLIDERPEEVTDFKRSIGADVYASSSDRPAHEHLRIAELVLERARRYVEAGEDVVVLLDSITRLARAYNKEIESSGRTMSGGVDSRALERPKRLFGAARNTEEAGSLTIIGTALVDTGSRMDEVIFEEFKGTGNMEIVLDRQLAERRLFPAVNINASGTRKEEKLFTPAENEKIRKLRAYLSSLRPVEGMEKLLSRLRDFRSNDEFFDAL